MPPSVAAMTTGAMKRSWPASASPPPSKGRSAKQPERPASVSRRITAAERYIKVSFAYQATVANDNTVRLGGLVIDIRPGPYRKSYARTRVVVRQHLDGAWTVRRGSTPIARHGPTPLREPIRTWLPPRP